jgi:cytochrome P450
MTATTADRDSGEAIELLNAAMLSDAGRQQPYPYLSALHTYGDAAMMAEGYLAVWDYDECSHIMRSPAYGRARPGRMTRVAWPHVLTAEQQRRLAEADTPDLAPWLQLIDHPEHTRQRSLVSRAFTPRRVDALRTTIEEHVSAHLDRIRPGQPVEFLEELAFPMPRHVIGELVGLPIDDRGGFAEMASAATAGERDPGATFEQMLGAAQSRHRLVSYVREIIEQRRREPREDLASALIELEQSAGDRLTEPEMIAVFSMMYMAAYSTTAHTLSNGLHALLTHPDEMARLRADPGLIDSAVEEILRYDTMVLTVDYCAKADMTVAGIDVPAGTPVEIFLGAANRDPSKFTEPDRFDITRNEAAPLSFGLGAHHCLGAGLARLEARIFFRALLGRFPTIELLDSPVRKDSFNYREFRSLWIACR